MDTQIESARIPTRVGPLNVRQVGNGRVALLWHSLFIDSTSWQRVEAELAHHRRLVLIDGPGHGPSGDPGQRYTMGDCATAAFEVLDALSVTEKVDWVGNAWGGHVGIVAATNERGRLRSLIALGTPVRAIARTNGARSASFRGHTASLGPAKFLTDGVAEVQLSAATRQMTIEAVALTTDFLKAADRRRLYNAIRSISLGREDLNPRLPRIDIPTLFVTGADHAGFTPDEARAAIAQVPGGQVRSSPMPPISSRSSSRSEPRSSSKTSGGASLDQTRCDMGRVVVPATALGVVRVLRPQRRRVSRPDDPQPRIVLSYLGLDRRAGSLARSGHAHRRSLDAVGMGGDRSRRRCDHRAPAPDPALRARTDRRTLRLSRVLRRDTAATHRRHSDLDQPSCSRSTRRIRQSSLTRCASPSRARPPHELANVQVPGESSRERSCEREVNRNPGKTEVEIEKLQSPTESRGFETECRRVQAWCLHGRPSR